MDLSGINLPLIIAVSTFLVICLIIVGIVQLNRQKRQRQELIEKIKGPDADWVSPQSEFESTSLTEGEAVKESAVKRLPLL